MYDYLIVGAGLFGATFANLAVEKQKSVLVLEKNNFIGGACQTKTINGINVHMQGPHIFHTSDRKVWNYIQKIGEFNKFINSPMASYKGFLYNLPFNMNTFNQLWGVKTPKQAKAIIDSQKLVLNREPNNLEEQALSIVGTDIYQIFIKGYTEKQWGVSCKSLSPEIVKRIPLRFTYDNNYFNDTYQGIPREGYSVLIKKMLKGAEVILEADYNSIKNIANKIANKIIYTGSIDEYFDYQFGELSYRSLEFKTVELNNNDNLQGVAVMNFTGNDVEFTRRIEHKHFSNTTNTSNTIITYEYPRKWKRGLERYYPINNKTNNDLYEKHKILAQEHCKNVFFGGRLGEYKYYNMDQTIKSAMDLFNRIN